MHACRLVVCKLLIILILLSATKIPQPDEIRNCHPFTFNFNLHEIMFFLLHFFQFSSSPPLFIFPYHFKVPPFSNVIFFCCNVLHLYPSNKCIIFISSLCPLRSHFLAVKLNLEKNNKLSNRDYFTFVNKHLG